MSKSTLNHILRAAVAGALLSAGLAAAQTSAQANAGATIVNPISIQKDQDLHFGEIGATGTDGTVQLTTAGVATASGGAQVGNAGSGAVLRQPARFTVNGDSGAAYSVTLPNDSSVTLTTNASASAGKVVTAMPVTSFTKNDTGTLTGGTETFEVGATLNVNANQQAAEYTGTFTVTVAYN